MKLLRQDNGKSICFRLPSNVSSPLITRSANPTGIANLDGDREEEEGVVSSKSGTNPTAKVNDLGAYILDARGVDARCS